MAKGNDSVKKRYINISVLVVCAIAVVSIYLYDVFLLGTAYTEKLLKLLCILCSIVLVFVRSNKRLLERNFQTYKSAYAHIIGNAFGDNPNLKRMLLLGIYDYNNGRYRRTIKRLSKLCRKAFQNNDVVPCMIFIALSYEDSGRVEEAIEMYKKVLKLSPQNATANNNIALLYSFKEDLEAALIHYEKAIVSNPLFEQAYLNRAQLYFENYRPDEAILDAEKVLDINNDSEEATLLLLVAHDLQRDEKNAKRYYNKALDLGYDAEVLDGEIEFYREMYEENKEEN